MPENERKARVRYSIVNTAMGFIAKVVHKAINFKKFFGGSSYTVAGIKELMFAETPPQYALEICQDDGSKLCTEVATLLMFINNGKYGGGHINFTPGACINDGLLDIFIKKGDFGVTEGLKLLKSAKELSGVHVFRDDALTYRSRSVTITNLNYEKQD